MDTRIAPASNILKNELKKVCPSLKSKELNVLYTFQNQKSDPLEFFYPSSGSTICKKEFFEFSKKLGDRLDGYWWDFIDPSTGAPVRESLSERNPDIDACNKLLGIQKEQMSLSFITHPLYNTEVFIGSFITDAPEEVLEEKLKELNDDK